MTRKLIVTNCRECPFFGTSVASMLGRMGGMCGCPRQSGPLHLAEIGGSSDHDKAARAHLESRRPVTKDEAVSVPAWCPLRGESVTVTLGS